MKLNLERLLTKIERYTGADLHSVRDVVAAEQSKPLSAAILGQTGSGKSSLTNAIFGTNFAVDDVKPCTKAPQAHRGFDAAGNPILFWDLPGIGESLEADQEYLKMYTEHAAACDVVLWAFQADTRTMTLDTGALQAMIGKLPADKRAQFLGKLVVVITKADVISPGPWIVVKDRSEAIIACSDVTEQTLDRKAEYFYEGLLGSYSREVLHRTFVSSPVAQLRKLPPEFSLDDEARFLYHQGVLGPKLSASLSARHPEAREEILRLHDQSKAVYCSAQYRFNLNAVKAMIAQKAKGQSMLRLSQSVASTDGRISWSEVKKLGLPVFFDRRADKVIFDVTDI